MPLARCLTTASPCVSAARLAGGVPVRPVGRPAPAALHRHAGDRAHPTVRLQLPPAVRALRPPVPDPAAGRRHEHARRRRALPHAARPEPRQLPDRADEGGRAVDRDAVACDWSKLSNRNFFYFWFPVVKKSVENADERNFHVAHNFYT